MTIAIFIAAMHGYRNSQEQLNLILDEELKTLASFILNNQYEGKVHAPAHIFSDPKPAFSNKTMYQVFNNNGELLASSKDAPIEAMSQEDGLSEEAFAGLRWRTYKLANQGAYVIVAQSDGYRRSVAEQILLATLVPVVFSIPLIGLLVFYIIRKSLSPLRYLSAELTNKHSEDLTGVYIKTPSKELVPVVNRLNELFDRLASSFELEKQLSANVAHELRTPISVLAIAANNLLEDFKQDTLTKAHFEDLSQNVERMAQVIEQIIGLFRFTSDSIDTKKSKVDIEKVLQEVISNNYLSLEKEQQTIELNAKEVQIYASEFALYVLFENLIRNANKYSGKESHIKIDVFDHHSHIEINVQDSGEGLPGQDMQKLTSRFFKASNQTSIKGSGLGLAISKHIISLHQGTLRFQNASLGGLLVKVELPKGYINAK